MTLLDRVFPPDQCDDPTNWGDFLGHASQWGRRGDPDQPWLLSWQNRDTPGTGVLYLISIYACAGPGADDEAIAHWRKEQRTTP